MYVRRKQEQNRNQIVHDVNAGLAFSPTFITVETMRDVTVGLCGRSNLNQTVILLAPIHLRVADTRTKTRLNHVVCAVTVPLFRSPCRHLTHFYCGKNPQNLWFLYVIYPAPSIHLW